MKEIPGAATPSWQFARRPQRDEGVASPGDELQHILSKRCIHRLDDRRRWSYRFSREIDESVNGASGREQLFAASHLVFEMDAQERLLPEGGDDCHRVVVNRRA